MELPLDRRQRVVLAFLGTWTAIGAVLLVWVGLHLLDMFRLAIIPLVLALFPAALLSPLSERLKRWMPPAAAAGVAVVGFLAFVGGTLWVLGNMLVDEVPEVVDAVEAAYEDVARWAEREFDVDLPAIDEALDDAEEWVRGQELGEAGRSLALTTLEVLSSILLLLIGLFFFLKDGARIFRFLVELSPSRIQEDLTEIGYRAWETLGGYFRGQLVVAAVDAFFIGIGLVLLGVPLALPLAIIVFLFGLFPIVGAFTAGALAVLVALADQGLPTALAVLALNVLVQQAEGNLLEPVIVGRATQLHPLLVIVALTAGAITLGVLGAFLAVPITACLVRAGGYLVERHRGETPSGTHEPVPRPASRTVGGVRPAADESG